MVEICAALGAHRFRAPLKNLETLCQMDSNGPCAKERQRNASRNLQKKLVDVSQHESNQRPSRIDELCNYKAHACFFFLDDVVCTVVSFTSVFAKMMYLFNLF